MKGLESKTYYELLGVTPEATKDEIKSAYREIARVYHPDSHFFDDILGTSAPLSNDDNDVFKTVTNAYNILTDDKKRAEYDRILPKGLSDWDSQSNFWPQEGGVNFSYKPQPDTRKAQAFGTFGRAQEAPKSAFDKEHERIVRPVSEVLRARKSFLGRLLGLFGLHS
ncbi:MAG: J domain-containing protein [Deltaproteobacteria bacterium]|nr:J domain-containing protein [Deltaproteobacteria bacterium]